MIQPLECASSTFASQAALLCPSADRQTDIESASQLKKRACQAVAAVSEWLSECWANHLASWAGLQQLTAEKREKKFWMLSGHRKMLIMTWISSSISLYMLRYIVQDIHSRMHTQVHSYIQEQNKHTVWMHEQDEYKWTLIKQSAGCPAGLYQTARASKEQFI